MYELRITHLEEAHRALTNQIDNLEKDIKNNTKRYK